MSDLWDLPDVPDLPPVPGLPDWVKHAPPGRQEAAWLGVTMTCGSCKSTGTVTDLVRLDWVLWLVTWTTGHAPGCSSAPYPARTYVMDEDAMADGDAELPGTLGPQPRPQQCRAVASTTGQRCKLAAGPDGVCGVHRDRR